MKQPGISTQELKVRGKRAREGEKPEQNLIQGQ